MINTREPFKVGANAPDTQTIEFIKTDPRVPVLDCGALWSYDNELYLFGGKLRNKTGREVENISSNVVSSVDFDLRLVGGADSEAYVNVM